MAAGWPETIRLLRSWPGRLELRRRHGKRAWHALAPIARVDRATLARRVRVVAVSGSVGKTTTMRAVSAALGLPVGASALLNANNYAALAGSVLRLGPRQRHAVLEVGIERPGDMRRYSAVVRPDVAVMTAVASDHWRSFSSIEHKRDEKAELVRGLPAAGTAVLNADDANVRWMAGRTRAKVVLFGFADDADVRATGVELGLDGTSFEVHVGGASRPVKTRLVGRHMIHPVLAAVAVAAAEERDLDETVAALGELEPTPGRMQPLTGPNGAVLLRDDFKGTDDAYRAALAAFAELPAARHVVVFGEVFEESGRDVYREIGRLAGAFAELAVFVGTRTKDLRAFRAGATAAGLSRERVHHARHADEAVAILRGELRPGDAVLIKGRREQALGRVGLALAGRDVRCRADPCPFRRMLCDLCPFLEQPFAGV